MLPLLIVQVALALGQAEAAHAPPAPPPPPPSPSPPPPPPRPRPLAAHEVPPGHLGRLVSRLPPHASHRLDGVLLHRQFRREQQPADGLQLSGQRVPPSTELGALRTQRCYQRHHRADLRLP